jgi:hypothetical protein
MSTQDTCRPAGPIHCAGCFASTALLSRRASPSWSWGASRLRSIRSGASPTTWEGLRGSASDRGSDAGASVGDDRAGHARLDRSRPAKNLSVAAGGGAVRSCRVAGGAGVRLAVNAGPNWLASGRPPAMPSCRDEVVVLTSCRDAQRTQPAETATETARGTGIEPPSCRGPPSLGRQRHARGAAGRAAPTGRVSPDGDPLVRDNLGQPVSVCAAEVAVIETYLGDALEELFASSKASGGLSGRERRAIARRRALPANHIPMVCARAPDALGRCFPRPGGQACRRGARLQQNWCADALYPIGRPNALAQDRRMSPLRVRGSEFSRGRRPADHLPAI